MRLSDVDIERYLAERRIVIEPAPAADFISGVSVDVRLGNTFRVFNDHTAPFIDLSGPREEVQQALDRVMSDEIYIADGDAFFLHPGELALAVLPPELRKLDAPGLAKRLARLLKKLDAAPPPEAAW